MAIKEKTVTINLTSRVINHYENLGYDISIFRNDKGWIPVGTIIKVKVEHLTPSSNVKLTKVCDYKYEGCLKESKDQPFSAITRDRKRNNGRDACKKCAFIKSRLSQKNNVRYENSLGFHLPELTPYWHPSNEKSIFQYNRCSPDKCIIICSLDDRHVYETSPDKLSAGRRCPFCAKTFTGVNRKVHISNCLYTYDPELSLYEWDWDYNQGKFGVTPFDVSRGAATIKYRWICPKCNHKYFAFIGSRTGKNKSGCPKCRQPKGEIKIVQFLQSKNIIYDQQVKFNECKDIRRLPFDFAVYNEKKELVCLIEFDGQQHYVAKTFWGGEKGLLDRKRRDQIKNDFCLRNNISLIRINYDEMNNIDNLLKRKLKEFT